MKKEIKLKYNLYYNYKNYKKDEILIIDNDENFPVGCYDVIRTIDDEEKKDYENKMMNTKNKKTKVK